MNRSYSFIDSFGEDTWIGAKSDANNPETGPWYWISDGRSFDASLWAPGQPKGHDKPYAAIHHDGKLKSFKNNHWKYVLCEKPR